MEKINHINLSKTVIVFLLAIFSSLFFSSSAFASQISIGAQEYNYTTYNTDYSYAPFVEWFTMSYYANEDNEHNIQTVSQQDYLCYRNNGRVVYAYGCNGTAYMYTCKSMNSAGSVTASFSSWSNGSFGSYLFPSNGITNCKLKNYGGNCGASGSYKIQLKAGHAMEGDGWTTPLCIKTLYTSYF